MGLALTIRIALTVWPRAGSAAGIEHATLPEAAAFVLINGSFLYATSRRRNWGRLALGVLFGIGVGFSLAMMLRPVSIPGLVSVTSLLILQGTGVAFLFSRTASAWFHDFGAAA